MADDNPRFDVPTLLSHQEWMRALAFQMVFDDQQADDIVQDTVVAALRSERSVESPKAWLATIMRNLVRRGYRTRDRRAARERQVARAEVQAETDIVERAELHGLVTTEVLALAEPYRSTVLLRFFDGLKPSEIAQRLDVPAATVRVRLKRALEQLRDRMDETHGQDRNAWCLLVASAFRLPTPSTSIGAPPPSPADAPTKGALPQGSGSLFTMGAVIVTSKKLSAVLVVSLLLAGVSYVAFQGGASTPTGTSGERASTDPVSTDRGSGHPGSVQSGSAHPAAVERSRDRTPAAVEDPNEMPVGRRLVGRVLSGDSDAPLAGILVRLTAANNETTLLAESDAAGTITVPAPEGRYTISVEHPTLVLASPAVCTHGATAEPFTIRLYEGGSLVGQVLDRATREAVANVLVHAETHGSLNAREVVTAEDGTFRLDGLSVSPLSSEITWRVPGFLPAPRANPNRILVSSGAVREGYVLLIDRGAIVQGQVFDESGAALQGATVHLLSRRGGAGSSSTLTDAAGEYLLTVPPGRYHLRATYDGLALVEGPFQVDWDGQQRDLTLSTEARVSGVLVDERDTPLARQVVHFRSKRTLSLEASAKTDDDGYFVAQNLTAGAYAVSGTYGDSDNRADAPPITVGAGEHLEDVVVVVQLNRAGAIRGRITDTYGRPAPHEFVRLTKDGKSHYGNTNALGEFEFLGLRDVVYTLAWRKERRQVAAGTDNVLLQEPRAEDSQMVTVKVLDGSGAPVHLFGFQVVRALSGTTATKATDHNEAAIHLTRAFSERVEVRVEAPEVGRGELVLEPDADGASELIVELRLTPAFAASVCVVDESGNPLADATVHDGPIGGDATRVLGRSLPDGTLRFDRAGLQQVFVTHPDFAPSVHALPTAGSVQLRLLQGVHVSGRVHDGARPAAFDVTIDCPGVGRLQILTDADGRFEARVPAGENQLGVMLRTTAELTSVRRLFQALGGEAGDSVDVEVVVPPMDAALSLGVLRGTVPVVNAMVQLRMELPGRLGLWLNAQADDQGNCLLENLPAGAVVVNVMDPAATQSMQAVTANATLIGGSTTRLEVQADSAPAGAATVRGTISTQRSGENVIVLLVPGEVTRGQVTLQGLQQLQANSIASRVDAGGSFEIVGVASGRHTLLALAIAGNIGTPQEFAQKTRIALVPVVVEGAGVSVVDLQLPVSGGSQ